MTNVLKMETRAGKIERVVESVESLQRAVTALHVSRAIRSLEPSRPDTEVRDAADVVDARKEFGDALADLMTPILRSIDGRKVGP